MFCRTHIDRCLCIWFSTTEEIDEINNLLEKFKLSDQMTLTQHYVGKPISGQHFLLLFIRLKYKFDTMELINKIKSTEKVLNFTLQFFSVCSAQKLCFEQLYYRTFFQRLIKRTGKRYCTNFYFCFVFVFLSGFFFHEHSRLTGQQGKGEATSLTPLYHFHLLHRH